MEIPAVRPSIKELSLVALWGLFLLAYFQRFPWPGFFSNTWSVLVACAVTLSAAGYGSWAGSRLFSNILNSLERLLLSVVLGFGILSLLMGLLGLLGMWTRWAAALLVLAGFLAGRTYLPWGHFLQKPDFSQSPRVPLILTGFGLLLGFLLAFAPITYYDSLVYHLALPQAYLFAGRWVALPDLIYSAFPQNLEMLWLLGLLLGNDNLVNLLGWIISLLGIFMVYVMSHRFFGRSEAWWSAAILALMPAYLLLSSGGYVDVGLSVFSLASLYTVMLWRLDPSRKMAVLAGILGGLAVGIKYTGALCVLAGLLILLFSHGKEYWKRNFSHGLILCGSAYLAFFPWMLKNLLVMGNPVFPFFYQWSLFQLNPWVGEAAAGYFFHGLTEYAPQSGWNIIKILWDIAVHGMEFGGGMDVLGHMGWGVYFLLLPLLWLATPLPVAVKALLGYAVAFYIPWAMSRPVLRFLIPLAPILAILSGYAWVKAVSLCTTRWFRTVARLALASILMSGIFLFFHTTLFLGSYDVLLGLQTKEEYLSHRLRHNYYQAAQFVNQLPHDTLTYIVGDQRGYYYKNPVIVTPAFNRNPLTDWANRAANPAALRQALKSHGITHILINKPEMDRLHMSYKIFPFESRGLYNWEVLTKKIARPVYRDAGCEVLEL